MHNEAGKDAASLAYIPGLDGLRALAIAGVLLYHAEVPWLAGGFLGVEIFFALSGYLITGLLVAEWAALGRVQLGRFWLRRARRLLPALFVLLAGVLAYARLWRPEVVAGLRGDVVAAALYMHNWHLIRDGQAYFETVGRPSLIRHVWSLAVEEQIYLVWPLVVGLSLRRWRLRRIAQVALLGALLSALLMAWLYDPTADPSRVYYGTDTRAAGFLLGGALALWRPPTMPKLRPGWRRWALDGAGLGALIGLGWLMHSLNEFEPILYRGGFVATSALTLVVCGASVQGGGLGRLLGLAPLRWIGMRSYSLYLWHWPVYMLTRPQLDLPWSGWPVVALRLALTVACAELSYRLVEAPVRAGLLRQRAQARRAEPRRWATWAAGVVVATVLGVGLGVAVATAPSAERPEYLTTEAIHVPIATQSKARRVIALGDSVMLGSADALQAAAGPLQIDAAVGMQAADIVALLAEQRAEGPLGDVAIVHVGNNGPVTEQQIDELFSALEGVPRVLLINVKVPRFWEGPNNALFAEAAGRYPQIELIDWYGASHARPELFWDDGIHLRPEGAGLYAALIADALKTP